MLLESEIRKVLTDWGATFVRFVDVSQLSVQQNKGFGTAILFGLPLTPGFILEVINTKDYVQELIRANQQDKDEFSRKETETDLIADTLANFLHTKGYSAYSQSERNLKDNDSYDAITHTTPLPHKTIAVMAGMGWIGKNNLLITNELGGALSMCSVLTNIPIPKVTNSDIHSKCGTCTICKDICPTGALSGKSWDKNTTRDEIVNVYTCTTCLKCLAYCPWTKSYAQKYLAR